MSEKKTTVEKLILLLNFNFHGKQFPSMKERKYYLGLHFWKKPTGGSSVCFGIRTLNMSQKVDHVSHPLIVAFPFNKEQLSILLFYSRPT